MLNQSAPVIYNVTNLLYELHIHRGHVTIYIIG